MWYALGGFVVGLILGMAARRPWSLSFLEKLIADTPMDSSVCIEMDAGRVYISKMSDVLTNPDDDDDDGFDPEGEDGPLGANRFVYENN